MPFLNPYFQLSLTVAFITSAELFLKQGAGAAGAAAGDWLGLSSLDSPRVWIGTVLLVASSITWILTLRAMPLARAFMLSSVIHVTIPLGSWLALGERIGAARWTGIALVLAGICIIAQPASRMEERT